VLNLASTTAGSWLDRALADFDAILLDHAHCERKAAGTALKLLFQYPDRPFLQAPVAELAREELAHFKLVLARLETRGVAFGRQRPSAYAGRLKALVRDGEPHRLVDLLLISALIEARSCERFQLLAAHHPEAAFRDFYAGLHAAEARHHGLYLQLAEGVSTEAQVRARLAQLARDEAEIIAEGNDPVRLHS
jgi:tRNA-(ms[2]io[6]A)-hydroxylase